MSCAEIRSQVTLYIDREIKAAEVLEIEAHLSECAACRRAYDELRHSVDEVRAARPLYDPTEQSYAAVREIVTKWDRQSQVRRWGPLAAALAVLAVAASLYAVSAVSAAKAGYGRFAAHVHSNYARNAFPLDVASSQPQVVSDWLKPRIPFHLKLPSYPEGGTKRYSLVGARVMQYRGEDVAYLAYEMDRKPISLLIASSDRIVPSGGESYQSGGLNFHFSSEEGLRIITWKDKGLTYAQVSDLNVKGGESCAICHGAEGERKKFEDLSRQM